LTQNTRTKRRTTGETVETFHYDQILEEVESGETLTYRSDSTGPGTLDKPIPAGVRVVKFRA
jgi:hypothetical protein